MDTCGYKLTFSGSRSVYHSADTSMCQLLLDCAPRADALLLCINNMNPRLFTLQYMLYQVLASAMVYPMVQKHFAKGLLIGAVKG